MKIDVSFLQPQFVDYVLADLRKHLRKSELWSGGRTEEADIVEFIRSGRMQLWVVQDMDAGKLMGYVVTEIVDYPRCSMLAVQYCAGDVGVLDAAGAVVFRTLENFARDGGCAGIEFYGRRGWLPHVKPMGYRMKTAVFEKYFTR